MRSKMQSAKNLFPSDCMQHLSNESKQVSFPSSECRTVILEDDKDNYMNMRRRICRVNLCLTACAGWLMSSKLSWSLALVLFNKA